MTTATNPERDQDRAEDLLDNWRRYGYVMFPQQRRIYEQLAERITGSVLEAGCGAGTGTAMLSYADTVSGSWNGVVGTDKCERNAQFARALYPWIDFRVWDIVASPAPLQADTVVAVEVIEHVADPIAALRNLLAAARHEVWLSTPNGRGKPRPPSNPFHVCEWTPAEMIQMIRTVQYECAIHVLGWEDFKPVSPDTTDVDPLVYRIMLP